MAFFPRAAFHSNNNEASFHPLFRLLDEFDKYSTQDGGNGGSNSGRKGAGAVTQWHPKFDIRETDTAYELHGELPGIDKKDVSIEFPEPQTLVVRGKTERTYTSGTPPVGLIEGGSDSQVASQQQQQQQQPKDSAKYWLSERSIGEFSRTFNFPTRVDSEAVTAGLKDGVLSVVVPKAKKPVARQIAIN
jgi:HSP20 family molecular chaperone IbpA